MPNNFTKTVTLKNGKSVLLRYPELADAQALMDYINPIIIEPARIHIDTPQTLQDEEKFLASRISEQAKGNNVNILAEYEGKIVGFTDTRRYPYKQRHVGLFGITVAKDFRGVGLGRVMANEVHSQAKELLKIEMVVLGVYEQNTPAVKLYEELGFVQYGKLPRGVFHAGNYETELFMYKNL